MYTLCIKYQHQIEIFLIVSGGVVPPSVCRAVPADRGVQRKRIPGGGRRRKR